MNRLARWVCLAAVLVGLVGCASYQLGDPGEPRVASLRLLPLEDRAAAPQVRGQLQRDLAEAFLQTGTVQLTQSRTSPTLAVVLTQWGTRERTTRSDDTGRAFSVELTLEAEVTLRDAAGGLLLNAVPVRAETTVFADPSLMDAQFQAMPQLTAELAQRIATLVSQPWGEE